MTDARHPDPEASYGPDFGVEDTQPVDVDFELWATLSRSATLATTDTVRVTQAHVAALHRRYWLGPAMADRWERVLTGGRRN